MCKGELIERHTVTQPVLSSGRELQEIHENGTLDSAYMDFEEEDITPRLMINALDIKELLFSHLLAQEVWPCLCARLLLELKNVVIRN